MNLSLVQINSAMLFYNFVFFLFSSLSCHASLLHLIFISIWIFCMYGRKQDFIHARGICTLFTIDLPSTLLYMSVEIKLYFIFNHKSAHVLSLLSDRYIVLLWLHTEYIYVYDRNENNIFSSDFEQCVIHELKKYPFAYGEKAV